jgi:hypothetical protein
MFMLDQFQNQFQNQFQTLRSLILSPQLSIQEQRRRLLEWLGAVFTDKEYHAALSSRLHGTCHWVLQ